jgi:transcriptional regulator with XRE-family HTH domain
MITFEQIRAARGLLGWTQRELADAAGISLRTLNMIEQGETLPRRETLKQIREALEAQQVAFGADHGVRLLTNRLEIERHVGPAAKEVLMKDVITQLRWRGGDVCYMGGDEEEFLKIDRRLLDTFYRDCANYKINEHVIVPKGYIRFVARPSHYRWLEERQIGQISYSVYGDTLVLVTGRRGDQLVFIRNRQLAEHFMRQFKTLWQSAVILPFLKFMKETEGGGPWTMARAEAAYEKVKKMGYGN